MARCLTLTLEQTQAYERGWQDERRVLDDVRDWSTTLKPHEPGMVMTADHRLASIVTGITVKAVRPEHAKEEIMPKTSMSTEAYIESVMSLLFAAYAFHGHVPGYTEVRVAFLA